MSDKPLVVPVLVPVAVDGPWSYRVPPGMTVRPGSIVRVPVGPREVIGAVWDGEADGAVASKRLRDIAHVYDAPPLDDDMRRFIDWVANWTLSPPGLVLRMVVRLRDALEPEPPVKGIRVGTVVPERMTAARERVLELASDGQAWNRAELTHQAGVSSAVVGGLVKLGALEIVAMPAASPLAALDPDKPGRELTPAQQEAAEALRASAKGGYSVTLIDGVTGSGKTEVYFEAVAEVLKAGKQALILLPEISLTAQFLERFEARFGGRPAEWHSDLAPKQRARVWRGVADGTVQVVVGARSALFLPFKTLGLIIVDEEHDTAFKQDDRVPYSARDMAVVRGHLADFPVVLSSATPAIESRVNADVGRYRRIVLSERATGAEMPRIEPVDMRSHGPERGRWLAPTLVDALKATIEKGAQALLFLNRRGYAPLTLCRACGHRFQCDNCSTWLVEHRFRGQLVCHHCGHQERKPDVCPECGAADSLVACGPGVERIAEEVRALFPDARALVLSSDNLGGPERMRQELKLVEEGGVDIVIGTQLVAKGHNFPMMTLVGVVDADLGLAHGDPRAAERTFQLLAQVTGRAGRIGGGGHGILQSYAPEHPVIQAMLSGDRDAFYSAEIEARRLAGLPPFGRLAGIVISGEDRAQANAYARAFAQAAPRDNRVAVLGPADAPLALVRGRHRFRILIQADRKIDLQAYLRGWLAVAPKARGSLRAQIDIDPQSFM
ncbi:primosomal protein N' [Breoghania sp. L-A4]|uniref:primosomal protein N' n=1 Tax=Breoghania sp. L-A4 TaxID=2304600 RepID=UPI0020BE2A39|nr:primosomal protein N' [Breoghania sp. L-A4]